jgi:PhzF family phenazine biosynthesis protein
MKLTVYHLDSFTDRPFTGNPAGVCPLEKWLDDSVMQSIAAENNLSETAFFVPDGADFRIRWFSPKAEVDLCGHATLASAHIIFSVLIPERSTVTFRSKTDTLRVNKRNDGLIELDFPSRPATPSDGLARLGEALGAAPAKLFEAADFMAVYETADVIRTLVPNKDLLAGLPLRGVIVTAPADDCDFVSRFFAPKLGIFEDPVTGSSHCTLTPYWSHRLGKKDLVARQISSRGGTLYCTNRGDRVGIAGHAVLFLTGTISI